MNVGLVTLVVSLGALVAWRPVGAPVALIVEAGAAGVTVWFARGRLGGLTSDVLGAATVVAETAALVVSSVW